MTMTAMKGKKLSDNVSIVVGMNGTTPLLIAPSQRMKPRSFNPAAEAMSLMVEAHRDNIPIDVEFNTVHDANSFYEFITNN